MMKEGGGAGEGEREAVATVAVAAAEVLEVVAAAVVMPKMSGMQMSTP